jgi:hypothetical protein
MRVFGLFKDKETKELAHRLATDLAKRVPPASLVSQNERNRAATEKALQMLTASIVAYRKANGLGLFKQIGLSKAFQAELDELGYEDEFIREATLLMAQTFAAK